MKKIFLMKKYLKEWTNIWNKINRFYQNDSK